MSLAIGVDVGGTKVAAGVVDEKGAILAQRRRPTPSHSPDDAKSWDEISVPSKRNS